MEDIFQLGIKALIRNRDGKLLLLKVNPAELTGHTKPAYWDLAGGRIQRGETVEDTLRRELAEETGITSVHEMRPLAMVLSKIRIPIKPDDVGLILSIYLCEADPDKITLSFEHTEYGWFSPGEAADLLQIKYPSEFTNKISEMTAGG